ncbi:ABC transporter substrate-binding protein [Nocardioides sp.]|uniref:ABC transporter substrate-binding protein n=1 Tax=Nocardioides sp. TaxID=35761 RepID=UPI0039E61598
MKRILVAAVAALLVLAGCGGGSESDPQPKEDGGAIGGERCAQNAAAGKITYLTGYYWQASVSILEVIAADALGYFDDLCLDVELQPGQGDVSQNTKLLASGQAQLGGLSEQDAMTANASGLSVLGISSYSDAGLDILMTGPDITDLAQLKGKTLGEKGWVPVGVLAMLGQAGLAPDDVKQVKVGYDPTVLTRGQVDALTGFISNEPNQLREAGEEVTVWQPKDFGVAGSLGSYAANPSFAADHPTAVEDFLRAVFKAYGYCSEAVDECLGYQAERAGADADPAHEKSVWTTETQVVADNPLPVKWGSVDLDNVRSLAGVISEYGGVSVSPDDAVSWFTNDYADKVVDDSGAVIWPAP